MEEKVKKSANAKKGTASSKKKTPSEAGKKAASTKKAETEEKTSTCAADAALNREKKPSKPALPGFEAVAPDLIPECVTLCESIAAYGLDSLSVAKDYFDALRLCNADERDFELQDERIAYMLARGKGFYDVVNAGLSRALSANVPSAADWYELKRKICLLLAPHSFDHYMQYVEWNREPHRKFWLPRRRVLMGLCNDLQDLEEHRIKFLGVSMPPRVGKLLSDDTPILTAGGWKRHGELKVGDRVLNPDGEFIRVTHVFPKCYANIRVHFSDGTHIDCHENHEWVVFNRHKHKTEIRETHSMMDDFETGKANTRKHRYFYQLPKIAPIIGEQKDLPVAPYSLGAWLGDGRNNNPDICEPACDRVIVDRIITDGYPISWQTVHKTTGVEYYGFKSLRGRLQALGMCHSRKRTPKRIPDIYLTASLEQRLELLAGLLDTDGTLIAKDHRYQFSTTEPELRDDFISLISTFGWRCSVKAEPPKLSSSGIQGRKTVYVIGFNPTCFIPCVVERKQLHEFSKQRRIAISGFERIEPVQGNCISVEGGVYLAGDRLIPTHNSTLCIFFLTWHMGRHPDDASAMGGHSDTLVNGFYGELNAVLDPDGEYLWHDVFPHAQIESRSAKYLQINLNHPKRFQTMTCRSAEGTWTGAIDISRDGILYVDDLIKDLEESLSPSRLDAKYNIYLNQMKDRMKDGALQLMVGTRWNVMDPLGRVREQYRGNPEYRFTVIPALDSNGESNFQYDYGVGFSTAYYRDMKNSIDDCTWCAKYQGAPYIRQGLVFPPDSLLRYNGILPDGQPDRIIAACDVAWGGDDYLAMPIVYIYGDGSMYCVDVVFSNANKTFTQPAVVGKLLIHRPHQVQFEANNGGTEYAQAVDKMLREKMCVLNISTRRAPGNSPKLSRIIQYAPDIMKIHFLDFDHSTPEYRNFIEWLCSFVSLGKNVHDDAPDALAQLMDLATGNWGVVTVGRRPW